jgi:hypothetical protein
LSALTDIPTRLYIFARKNKAYHIYRSANWEGNLRVLVESAKIFQIQSLSPFSFLLDGVDTDYDIGLSLSRIVVDFLYLMVVSSFAMEGVSIAFWLLTK